MDLLVELWKDFKTAPLLWQLVLIIFVVWGVIKGFIKIPFINVRVIKKKSCKGSFCDFIPKHIKIWTIKTQETIYEQLSIAENTNTNITMMMIDLYGELTVDITDIEAYKDIVTILEYEVRGRQKKWFKENHYTQKTESEFISYIEDKTKTTLQFVTTTLNRKKAQLKVDRDILLEHNTKFLIPYAIEEFRKMYYAVREVSRARELEVKNIEKELGII